MTVNRALNIFVLVVALPSCVHAQGTFEFSNPTAPTRLGAVDGPLAGPGIWAMPLAGLTADSLAPLYVYGAPVEHFGSGYIEPRVLRVPWAFSGTTIFVQLAAWEGTIRGTNFANVPVNQVGYTDIVPVFLVPIDLPHFNPQFTQPAIVPVVPEPSVLTMIIFGGTLLFLRSNLTLVGLRLLLLRRRS